MERQMFFIMSHPLITEQKNDAFESLGVTHFIELDESLKKIWSAVPADMDCEGVKKHRQPLMTWLEHNALPGDYVLVQGDYGATFHVVNVVMQSGVIPVYATSRRKVTEQEVNGTVIKTGEFRHVRYRRYEACRA